MKKSEPWTTLAYDESNHCRYPEMCVVAVSNFKRDLVILENDDLMGKLRKDHGGLADRLEKRNYAFLDFSFTAHELIPENYKIGIVLANLIRNRPLGDHLDIYIDGLWNIKTIRNTRDILQEFTGLEKNCIEITFGKDLDKKIPLVNIADETAHWLYGTPPSEWMKQPITSHKQELHLKDFFDEK